MSEPGDRAGFGPDTIVLRPRLLLICAWVGAVAIVVIFAVVAYLMPGEDTGVIFRPADQISMMVLGVLIAAGLLLMARPRVRADARGIEVRNIGVARWFPWTEVEGVAFPDGTSWARLDLPDDEYHPVLAVQAVDRGRAVDGIRRLRALHRDALRAAERSDESAQPQQQAEESQQQPHQQAEQPHQHAEQPQQQSGQPQQQSGQPQQQSGQPQQQAQQRSEP